MDRDLLLEDMEDILAGLANKDVEITEDTIPEDVLSTQEFTDIKETYREGVCKIINDYGGDGNKDWPLEWWKKSLKELSQTVGVLLLFISLSFSSKAQVQVNLSAGKSDLKTSIIDFSIKYIQSAVDLSKQKLTFKRNSVFALTPFLDIQSGTADALNGISAKVTGNLLTFKNMTGRSGHTLPDFSHTFWNFPFGVGLETDNAFSFYTPFLEVGAIPCFVGNNNPDWLRHVELGAWLQAGYKSKMDSMLLSDQSQEKPNSGILRFKASLRIDTKTLARIGMLKFGLIASGDVWQDFMNNATYHRVDGIFRVYLNDNTYLDLAFQHGSGAPLFNNGTQWVIGATTRL